MLRERSGLARFTAESYTHEASGESLSPSTTISPRLELALEELPPKIGDVIRKVDIEELSYREVADEMRIPIGTVMSRLFRGRRRLAESVADEMLPAPAQAA